MAGRRRPSSRTGMAMLTSFLGLLTRVVALGLAAAALSFYRSGVSQNTLSSSLDWSRIALCLQFILSLVEITVQLVRLFRGLRPLPHEFQQRFWILSTDVVFAVITWGSTSAVLRITSFLRHEGFITHATYLQLHWHGRLGLACGIVSALTAIANAFAANETEAQQQQQPLPVG